MGEQQTVEVVDNPFMPILHLATGIRQIRSRNHGSADHPELGCKPSRGPRRGVDVMHFPRMDEQPSGHGQAARALRLYVLLCQELQSGGESAGRRISIQDVGFVPRDRNSSRKVCLVRSSPAGKHRTMTRTATRAMTPTFLRVYNILALCPLSPRQSDIPPALFRAK